MAYRERVPEGVEARRLWLREQARLVQAMVDAEVKKAEREANKVK